MEYVNCPICHQTRFHTLFTGHDLLHSRAGCFAVVQCGNCDTVYLNPRPSKSEIGNFYPPEYMPHHLSIQSGQHWWSRIDYRYGLTKRCKAVMRYKNTGRLLDVGCATGEFLARARELGWQVCGVELSQHAADYARERAQLDVFVGELEDAPFPDGSFDAVTMWNVFEHLFDPETSIQKISRLLTVGGIAVITIPNLHSLDLKLFGKIWSGYDVPRHLYLVPQRTLERFLDDHGFEIVDTRCLYGSYHAFWLSIQFYFRSQKKESWYLVAAKLSRSRLLRLFSMPYFFLLDRLQAGTILTVTCRKKS